MPILQKFYLVKLCPIFGSSQSLAPWRYQKILLGSSLGCETILNFIWSSVKFHNRQHTNTGVYFNYLNTCLFLYLAKDDFSYEITFLDVLTSRKTHFSNCLKRKPSLTRLDLETSCIQVLHATAAPSSYCCEKKKECR